RVARLCAERDAVLVHFSTDYVFDGRAKEPYTEDDAANPLSVYGASKLSGEHLVRLACPRHFVVRTCGLYGRDGSRGKGGNFVTTMLRLAGRGTPIRVVADQALTPTATKDLASLTRRLLDTAAYGLYHATAAGQCSWYEFAARIFELAGLHPELSPISTEEFGAAARRPAYSVLDNAALRSIGLDDLRPWDEALAEFVRALDV